MKVLITGICGFVGNVIARGLRESYPDWEIHGIDNFVRPGSELNRISLIEKGVNFTHADLRCANDLAGLKACNWIIDAAANPSVLAGIDGKKSSIQVIDNNLLGTINLLELAKNWNSGIIILSTSRVYSINDLSTIQTTIRERRFHPILGHGFDEGIKECFSCHPPVSLYGASKLASELLSLEYGGTFNFPVFINRCGLMAGEGQFGRSDQGIVSYWIRSWSAQRPMNYIGFDGSGLQVRDCMDPHDLIPLLSAQIQSVNWSGPRVVNVGGGMENSFSLLELSDWCEKNIGFNSVGSIKSQRKFDVPWLVLDYGKCQSLWKWNPKTSLAEIFERIARHAISNPKWLDLTA